MKTLTTIIGIWAVFCGHTSAQTNQAAFPDRTVTNSAKPWEQFKCETNRLILPNEILTLSGQHYDEVKVEQVFTNELMISYVKPNGVVDMATISSEDLPPVWKKLCKSYGVTSHYVFAKTNQIIIGAPPVVSLSLALSNGVVLEIIKIDSIDPDGLNVAYLHLGSSSLDPSYKGYIDHVKIPFELLSKEVQKKYDYDPAAAYTYRKQVAADYAEYKKEVEEQNEKIAAQEAERKKEELDLIIKIEELQALQAQAEAAQRQADAQERAANAQENQSLSQQQIKDQLEDFNWQLMRLRQQEQRY